MEFQSLANKHLLNMLYEIANQSFVKQRAEDVTTLMVIFDHTDLYEHTFR